MQNKMEKSKAPDSSRTISIILSVVIALILWSYVIIQINPTKEETIPKVPVQLLNVQSLTARQLAILGDGEYTVDVVVEGRRADIIKVSSYDIVAEADLFGWSKGENYITVNVKVPPALKVVEVKSAKIQVTIEDLVALSKPVIISYRGDFPGGTEVGGIDIRPAEIEVAGAKSAVNDVKEVRVYVDVDDINPEGRSIQCEAIPLNDAEMTVENVKLSSSYVSISAKVMNTKEVALTVDTVGEPDEGYGVEIDAPKTIVIKGLEEDIKDLEDISAEPIDVSKIKKNGDVRLSLHLPSGIELSKKSPKPTASVRIEQISTKQFLYEVADVSIEGLADGREIEISEVEISVIAVGRKQIVDLLTKEQLKLHIEVGELALGNSIAPLMVMAEVPLHSINIEPAQVSVTIAEAEQENIIE